MRIDALATERHFVDHLAPVWLALPEEIRGSFFCGPAVFEEARLRGIQWPSAFATDSELDGPTLVCSYGDLKRTTGPVVYMEHGIGQTYINMPGHGSYPGGLNHERVELFLVPSPRVSDLWAAAYPDADVQVVGIPRMDRWHRRAFARNVPRVVAISFHWNAQGVAPEAMWAFPHYMRSLGELAAAGWTVIGHGHPRAWGQLLPWYRRHGIEPVRDFEEVLERADVYVCDNSSTIYEFASTGRPVVLLNAPWYRRSVHHGVRFWDAATVGLQVDDPSRLVRSIEIALRDPAEIRRHRRRALEHVIPLRDGHAAERAAAHIRVWLHDLQAVAA